MKQSLSAIVPFRFESQDVRTVKDEKGEPWFIAKDVCNILGYVNSRKAVDDHLDDDEKGVTIGDTLGGKQELTTINESGLYALIFRSNKPEAKKFRKWVTSEVLPAIRKDGFYGIKEKRCSQCRQILPVDMFQRDSRTKTGLQTYCNDCRRENRRLSNPSKCVDTQSGGIVIPPDKLNKLYLKAFYFISDCHELLRKAS